MRTLTLTPKPKPKPNPNPKPNQANANAAPPLPTFVCKWARLEQVAAPPAPPAPPFALLVCHAARRTAAPRFGPAATAAHQAGQSLTEP